MKDLEFIKIDNGIRVCFDKTNFVESCAIGVICDCGGFNEDESNLGISHFIEHMIFKGTETKSAKDITTSVEKLGARINAYTSTEHTCFYIKCMKKDFNSAADILFDIVNNSIFDEKELRKERKVIIEEMNMYDDSPDDLSNEKATILSFKNSRYGRPLIGFKKTLNTINSDSMKEYFNKQYTKDSIIISICGNFEKEEALSLINKYFNDFNDTKIKPEYDKKEFKPITKIIKKDIQQTSITFSTIGRSLLDDKRLEVSFFSETFGGGMSSRLFQNIREKQGLCYSVYTSNEKLRYDGLFKIYGGVSHQNVNKFIDSVNKEIVNLKNNPLTKEEFLTAKAQILSSFIYGSENILTRMFINARDVLYYQKLYSINEKINITENIKYDDVIEESLLYSNPDNYLKVIVTGK